MNTGRFFVYWLGTKAKLNIPDVDLVKELLCTKFGHYEKLPLNRITRQLMGGGMGSLDGEEWAKHRRIINPVFYIEQLKVSSFSLATYYITMNVFNYS